MRFARRVHLQMHHSVAHAKGLVLCAMVMRGFWRFWDRYGACYDMVHVNMHPTPLFYVMKQCFVTNSPDRAFVTRLCEATQKRVANARSGAQPTPPRPLAARHRRALLTSLPPKYPRQACLNVGRHKKFPPLPFARVSRSANVGTTSAARQVCGHHLVPPTGYHHRNGRLQLKWSFQVLSGCVVLDPMGFIPR
jgi:hypothetical protein